MASHSPLEMLSTELFENIISQIDEPRDLSMLCLVSRAIYQRAVPKLYQSWTYHGYEHSSKSLRNFLQTVIWRPDLAAHVRTLDVREWGHCRRLENEYGCPWSDESKWVNIRFDDAKDRENDWGYSLPEYLLNDDGAMDEDYEDSDAQSYGSDSSEEFSDSDAEVGSDVELEQLIIDREDEFYDILKSSSRIRSSDNEKRAFWDRVIYLHLPEILTPEISQLLRTAAIEAGLDRDVLLKHHASVYTKNCHFAVLVAHLLASLPNLQHLFMVFTEPDYWTSEQKAIQRMLNESFEKEDNAILQSLETLHISSALHISAVSHREYDLQLEFILPFMRLKNLRALRTLLPHTDMDRDNNPPPDIDSYLQSSSITHLVLDESDLYPGDALKTLKVPKALQSVRWTQEFACFSLGSCYALFHNSIGDTLKAHKDTLTDLDLDIRQRYCRDQGHAANPYAAADFRLPSSTWNSEQSIRPPRDAILIGSLKEFNAMKTLSIDATALCGHQNWIPAPTQMVDALPPYLETLNLRVVLRRINAEAGSESRPPSRLDNTLWISHLTELVRNAEQKLPTLKNVGILIHGRDWPAVEDNFLLEEIREECSNAGFKLSIEDEPFGTKVPFFQEQTKNWWLGRDYWHQRQPMHYIH